MQIVDEIIMLPLDEIKPYEKNPRKNDKTIELLTKVLPTVGFNVPLVLDHDHVIVKGHARYFAAKQLGMPELPCVISDADPESIKADRIADNKVFEFSRWLNDELAHEVDMVDIGIDMSEFGLQMETPAFDWDDDVDLDPAAEEERKRRFMEMMQEQAVPVQIVSETAIESAKMAQAKEVKTPPKYFAVECEECGHTMFVREGDAMTWE